MRNLQQISCPAHKLLIWLQKNSNRQPECKFFRRFGALPVPMPWPITQRVWRQSGCPAPTSQDKPPPGQIHEQGGQCSDRGVQTSSPKSATASLKSALEWNGMEGAGLHRLVECRPPHAGQCGIGTGQAVPKKCPADAHRQNLIPCAVKPCPSAQAGTAQRQSHRTCAGI